MTKEKKKVSFLSQCLIVLAVLFGIGGLLSRMLTTAPKAVTHEPFAAKQVKINNVTKNPTTSKPSTEEPAPTLEYQMATINAHGYIPEDHITVMRFRSLLEQLSNNYVENKQQIADMTIMACQLLKKDGLEESPLNIMEGINQLFSQKIENQKYAEYVSAYVTLRSKGRSHEDAILGLKAMLQSMGVY